jgi:hypothetical protein
MAENNYTYTQEDELGFVTTSHGADVLQDTNEVRQILQDLGEALSHAGFINGSYPKDKTPHPYVRGASSDNDFEISVDAGKVIKLTSRESGGDKTLYFKYNSTKTKFLFSVNGTNYFELIPADFTELSDGEIPIYDGDNSKFINILFALESLADLDLSSPGAGDWLKFDSISGKWVNAQPELNDLSDVNISSPQNGDYLKYNGTFARWENSSS